MKNLFTLLLLLMPLGIMAISDNDTIVWKENKQIIIQSDSNSINMQIVDPENNFKRIYETHFENENSNTRWEIATFVNVPFSNMTKKNKKSKKKSFDPNWAGVGFGFVNACDGGMKFINSTSPTGVSINFSKSYEIFWNILDIGLPLVGNNFGLVLGFGMDWRNYVLNGNRMFYDNNGYIDIQTAPESCMVKKSRLKRVDIVLPVMFEYQWKNGLYWQLGAQMNIQTHTSMKTKFKYSDNPDFTNQNMNGIGSNPVGVDLVARVGFENLGIYAKYSPVKMFESIKGPDMRSFSTGLILTY